MMFVGNKLRVAIVNRATNLHACTLNCTLSGFLNSKLERGEEWEFFFLGDTGIFLDLSIVRMCK